MNSKEYELKQEEIDTNECNQMLEAVVTYSKIVLQNVILVNGMGIISIMTFIGNITNQERLINYNQSLIFWGISSFCTGLFLGLLGSASGYFAQKYYRDTYVEPKKEKEFEKAGDNWNKCGVICVFTSIAAFFAGAFLCLNGIFPD